jgi:hypothetical protein
MKSLLVCLFAATICLAAADLVFGDGTKAKNPNLGKLRHVVLFKFKEGTPPEQVKKIEEAFGKLPSQIPAIDDFEWGTNNSPEGLDQGFTHCFLVTFKDAKGRDAYLPHPAHQEFVKLLRPHLDKVLVIDYFAQQ